MANSIGKDYLKKKVFNHIDAEHLLFMLFLYCSTYIPVMRIRTGLSILSWEVCSFSTLKPKETVSKFSCTDDKTTVLGFSYARMVTIDLGHQLIASSKGQPFFASMTWANPSYKLKQWHSQVLWPQKHCKHETKNRLWLLSVFLFNKLSSFDQADNPKKYGKLHKRSGSPVIHSKLLKMWISINTYYIVPKYRNKN